LTGFVKVIVQKAVEERPVRREPFSVRSIE
jgi:hypothetical protein